MKKILLVGGLLFAVIHFLGRDDPSGISSMCLFGKCSGDDFEIIERNYDPEEGIFAITGNKGDRFTSNTFDLQPARRYEGLSFGLEEASLYRELSVRKRMHIFNDRNLKIYQEQFSGKENQCPAGWVHQHLELVLLIPANEETERQLEAFELDFDPNGTPFALEGHFLKPRESYFVHKGERYAVTLAKHESALSNVGSANHPIHHFLVTGIP